MSIASINHNIQLLEYFQSHDADGSLAEELEKAISETGINPENLTKAIADAETGLGIKETDQENTLIVNCQQIVDLASTILRKHLREEMFSLFLKKEDSSLPSSTASQSPLKPSRLSSSPKSWIALRIIAAKKTAIQSDDCIRIFQTRVKEIATLNSDLIVAGISIYSTRQEILDEIDEKIEEVICDMRSAKEEFLCDISQSLILLDKLKIRVLKEE